MCTHTPLPRKEGKGEGELFFCFRVPFVHIRHRGVMLGVQHPLSVSFHGHFIDGER